MSIRSATYAYPTTLQLRELLERKYPHQVCVGEATWAVLFATLCELIALFRPDPALVVIPSQISRQTSAASTDYTENNGRVEHGEPEDPKVIQDELKDVDDRDKLYVDALHLRAVDNLLCAALESPAALSMVYVTPGSRHHKKDRSGKRQEVGPSPYVKMTRLLVK